MNERIRELKKLAMVKTVSHGAFGESESYWDLDADKFAELIIEDVREVLANCYQLLPLERAGSMLFAEEQILDHFYGDESDSETNVCPKCGLKDGTTTCGMPNCGLTIGYEE